MEAHRGTKARYIIPGYGIYQYSYSRNIAIRIANPVDTSSNPSSPRRLRHV